jgi:regulatory protein
MKSRTVRKLSGEELVQHALKLLNVRALSASELRTKLMRRAAQPEDVGPAIEKMKEYGFVDDSRFAEGYASARRESGSYGKQRVLRGLQQRKVSASVAQKAAEAAYRDTDETDLVRKWLERKFRNIPLTEYLKEEKHLASAYRKLRYAGFSSAASIRVLKQFAARAEELDDLDNDSAC